MAWLLNFKGQMSCEREKMLYVCTLAQILLQLMKLLLFLPKILFIKETYRGQGW